MLVCFTIKTFCITHASQCACNLHWMLDEKCWMLICCFGEGHKVELIVLSVHMTVNSFDFEVQYQSNMLVKMIKQYLKHTQKNALGTMQTYSMHY